MTPPSEDELLSSAGMPHWVWRAAMLAAVALLVALVMVKAASHSDHPAAAPTAPHSSVSVPPVPVANAAWVRLPAASPADDVATDGEDTWVLQRRTLVRLDHGRVRAVANTAVEAYEDQSRLLLDATGRRLWVVVLGVPNPLLQAFDALTLHAVNSVPRGPSVISAAVLHGSLYFADRTGLYRVSTGWPEVVIPFGRNEQAIDIVADARRSRVLMLVSSNHRLELWQTDADTVAVSASAPSGLANGQLGVTGAGEIWVAGFGNSGAVLVRLDPATLRPLAVSPLAQNLGPGALLLGTGTDTLYIGSGGGGEGLWCMAGRTGASVQRWSMLAHRVTSTSGRAYAALSGGLVHLDLAGRCTG